MLPHVLGSPLEQFAAVQTAEKLPPSGVAHRGQDPGVEGPGIPVGSLAVTGAV
jgi:hypothetical protein